MRTLRETQGESIGIPEVAAFRTLLLWCGRRDALAEMVCEDFEYEPGTDALKALVP